MSENSNEISEAAIVTADANASATPDASTTTAPRIATLAGLIGLLVCLLIYLLRLDRVVGLFVDDAWYVLLAKALATGQGYALLNSPTPGILPLYPPAFPFVLSLVFRLAPSFPENVYLFKAVSIVAMLGAGWLAYRYFQRDRGLPWFVALGIMLASVLSPMLVFLATSSVMSECFFTLIFLTVVVLIERSACAEQAAKSLQWAALAGVVTAVAFLTRSIGLALIVAGSLYLLKEKLLKSALIFAGLAVLLSAPWVIYTRLHAPTPEQQHEQGGHIVMPYTQQFWQRRAGFDFTGEITVADLPARVVRNLVEITGRDVLRIVAAPVFEVLRNPFEEAKQERVMAGGSGDPLLASFLLSVLVVLGFIAVARQKITMAELAVGFSLGITVLWPWETVRFMLPLIPFIVFYFLSGVRALYGWYQQQRQQQNLRAQWVAMAVVASLIVAINLYGHVHYILKASSSLPLDRPQWLQIFDEFETLIKWVDRGVPKNAVLATANPALVYLYTGNKTIAPYKPEESWPNWNRLGIRYLVRASVYPEVIDPAESKYKVTYRSRSGMNFRVIDLGDPNNRPAWGSTDGR